MSGNVAETYVTSDEWSSLFDSSREKMNIMGELIEAGVQKSIEDNAAAKSAMIRTIVIIDIAVLLVVILLSFIIIRAITGPLKESVHMLQDMVRGRLSRRLNLDLKDEIGTVIKMTVDNLKALIKESEMLTKAVLDGNLGARGNAEAFSGGYKNIEDRVHILSSLFSANSIPFQLEISISMYSGVSIFFFLTYSVMVSR